MSYPSKIFLSRCGGNVAAGVTAVVTGAGYGGDAGGRADDVVLLFG